MDIDIGDIKVMRKKTSAGMLDCMKALSLAKGDITLAEALLKEWGLAGVEERSGRAAKEGRVFIRAEGSTAAMVELVCGTDFVSRGEAFLAAGGRIVDIVYAKKLSVPDSETEGLVAELASILKENVSLRHVAYLECGSAERVYAYLHGDGRIGALLLARADSAAAFEDEKVAAFFHDLALHIAAFHPLFMEEASVPDSHIEERTKAFRKEVEDDERMAGKSAAILEGAVAGKMRKHLMEVCLLGRGFVKDEKVPVARIVRELGKDRGFELSVARFAYFGIGDGLENA